MNIRRLNNLSFGAVMIEDKTAKQQELLRTIISKPEFKDKIVKELSQTGTDIYITKNRDGKSIDIKLKKSAGKIYNYVPFDNKGRICSKLKIGDKKETLDRKIRTFFLRAKTFLQNGNNNPKNIEVEKYLTELAKNDFRNGEISMPYNIPSATTAFLDKGEVITKNYLNEYMER